MIGLAVVCVIREKWWNMWKTRRFWVKTTLLVVLAGLGVAGAILLDLLPVLSGYTAKTLASGVFVSGRALESVRAEDLDPTAQKMPWRVSHDDGSLTVSLFGLGARTARFEPGLGVTLLPPGEAPAPFAFSPAAPAAQDPAQPWPLGGGENPDPLTTAQRAQLDTAVDWAFEEFAPGRPWNTRAVVVAHGGRLLAEQYAPGITRDTPLLGWSMSKSVVNALVGILVKRGALDIRQPAPVAEWAAPGDPRGGITLEHLLWMSSGLAFNEDYGDPYGDVLTMLFREPDCGTYAASRPLLHAPGTVWDYSSGTTNLICRILREQLDGEAASSLAFPRAALFAPLGMTSAVMEPDASGAFIGSSYTFATARDWARFGQLYLQDGEWNGERILPEGWVAYSTTPAPTSPRGHYGAQWWLNAGEAGNPDNRAFPDLPADLYYASGHEGQFVVVVPSRDAVIVRLGLTRDRAFDLGHFVGLVLQALPAT